MAFIISLAQKRKEKEELTPKTLMDFLGRLND